MRKWVVVAVKGRRERMKKSSLDVAQDAQAVPLVLAEVHNEAGGGQIAEHHEGGADGEHGQGRGGGVAVFVGGARLGVVDQVHVAHCEEGGARWSEIKIKSK